MKLDSSAKKIFKEKYGLKPEYIDFLDQIMTKEAPQDQILSPIYGLNMIRAKECRRKILNINNAFLAIERRLTYDMIIIFNEIVSKPIDTELLHVDKTVTADTA